MRSRFFSAEVHLSRHFGKVLASRVINVSGGFMNKRILVLAALVSSLGFLGAQLKAQQAPPNQSGQQQAPDSQAQAQPPQSGGQIYAGTIMKSGDKYVLKDASGTSYDIDRQDLAKKYEGQKVRIQGTLDPDGKTIHVK
jgi:uncharacterized protein YdeI (BOF family)